MPGKAAAGRSTRPACLPDDPPNTKGLSLR